MLPSGYVEPVSGYIVNVGEVNGSCELSVLHRYGKSVPVMVDKYLGTQQGIHSAWYDNSLVWGCVVRRCVNSDERWVIFYPVGDMTSLFGSYLDYKFVVGLKEYISLYKFNILVEVICCDYFFTVDGCQWTTAAASTFITVSYTKGIITVKFLPFTIKYAFNVNYVGYYSYLFNFFVIIASNICVDFNLYYYI